MVAPGCAGTWRPPALNVLCQLCAAAQRAASPRHDMLASSHCARVFGHSGVHLLCDLCRWLVL
eukprot:12649909-Alexandrium_andersonii.AAC.1